VGDRALSCGVEEVGVNRSGLAVAAVAASLLGSTVGVVVYKTTRHDVRPAPVVPRTLALGKPGDPLRDLTPELYALFNAGEDQFLHEFSIAEGLGPVFIERSCVACHAQGGVGGGDALDDSNHALRRFGKVRPDGSFDPMTEQGGDVLQTRSISEIDSRFAVDPERVPSDATVHSARMPPAIFGAGLIDAIDDATILAGAIDEGDGIHGRPNRDASGRVGRFGWKAQRSTLEAMSATAMALTLGITSPRYPDENRPRGAPIPADVSDAALGATTPNDIGGRRARELTAWAALLAPIAPLTTIGEAMRGAEIFGSIGCGKCHVTSMATGDYQVHAPDGHVIHVDALSRKSAALYSDLLLHDMGPDFDDPIPAGDARGTDFRTSPLWGLRLRRRFLHDGRAASVDAAIRGHGGEATNVRDRYLALGKSDSRALLQFLSSL
jgi:CxxC motif-containing protein (DUF1111 family)